LAHRPAGDDVTSPRGLAGAVAFLAAVPIAAVYQSFFATGVACVIHLALATGAALTASAVADFRTSVWMRWMGGVSMGTLAVIFFVQAVAEAARNDTLSYVAYQVLGQGLERWLGYGFLAWCVAVLVTGSRGWIRLLGCAAVAAAALARVLDLSALSLLPFLWLACESARRRTMIP
jgi:hypothetical protein